MNISTSWFVSLLRDLKSFFNLVFISVSLFLGPPNRPPNIERLGTNGFTLSALGTLGLLGNTGSLKPFGLGRGPCPAGNGTLNSLFL